MTDLSYMELIHWLQKFIFFKFTALCIVRGVGGLIFNVRLDFMKGGVFWASDFCNRHACSA